LSKRLATIPRALATAVTEFGDDEAVSDGDVRLSFRQLGDLAMNIARALVASGVEPGDRVALWAPNCWEWIVASFGVYSAGAVLVPLNTRFKSAEASQVLRRSGALLLLTVDDFLGCDFAAMALGMKDVPELKEIVLLRGKGDGRSVEWLAWLERSNNVDARTVTARSEDLNEASISDIIFTSGTTGAPKGAILTHGASVRTYLAWSELVGLRRGDRFLVVFPFFQTSGLKSGILACVLRGATMVPFAVFDVERLMDCVSQQRISMLPGPPTVFQSILNHPDLTRFDLSSLRLSVTGAATVPVEVIRRMRAELHFETIVTGYGLTETTGTVSMCRHDDPPEVIAETVGRPLPGVEVKIVEDSGVPAAQGDSGEILVRGFNVMKGYFHDEEATRAAIDREGWLKTGDIGLFDVRGNLRITDRKKDMYIAGGFNVYPAEVESIVLEHPAVAQIAVVGVPDERMGEVGAAFVVLRHGAAWDDGEFVSWCRRHMANYKVPRFVRVTDALPVNPNGKVMKFKLRDEMARSLG
jgi:HIP---CoA ligase